jgi:Tfp pilus assembly protein PilN
MLNYLKNWEILKSNKVIGLHCTITGNGHPVFSYTILRKKKGNVEIEHQEEVQCEPGKLSEHVSVKYPIYLSIDGRGILHKRIDSDSTKSPIQQAIPNAHEDDFIVEQYPGTDHTTYLSFARKSFVDELLSQLTDQKYSVISLTLSPFKAVGCFGVFDQLVSPIRVGPYEIEVNPDDQTIISFRKQEIDNADDPPYTLGENRLSPIYVLSFYHALTYYIHGAEIDEYPPVAEQKTEYAFKRLFLLSGWGILIFLFVILGINVMVFTNLSEEKQQLETQVSGNKEILHKLEQVKEELSWKERFLGQAGLDRRKWLSYFADQIAASVPEDITLEKLDLHPVISKIRKSKEIEMKSEAIRIEGITKTSLSVNDWALALKKMPWIANVVVENFSQIENSSTGIFTMEIKLATTNN